MWRAGATLHRSAWASHCRGGLSCCGAQAPDAQAQYLWLTGPVTPRHVGSSQTRARIRVSCIGRRILNHCATREAQDLMCFFYSHSTVNISANPPGSTSKIHPLAPAAIFLPTDVLTTAYQAPCHLAHCHPPVSPPAPTPLCSCHADLLAAPQTPQPAPALRPLHCCPFGLEFSRRGTHRAGSLISFWSLLRCHLLSEPSRTT